MAHRSLRSTFLSTIYNNNPLLIIMPLVVVVLQQLSVTPTTITPQIIIIHRQRRPVYSERLWLESKESAGNVESNFVAAISPQECPSSSY
jgi:hypothetical protein